MRLPAGLPFQNCPRVVAYALLAAVITTGLLAADGAYRWYQDGGMQVAEQPITEPSAPEPLVSEVPVPERSVQAPEPATAETRHAETPPHTQGAAAAPEIVGVAEQPEPEPDTAPTTNTAAGSIPIPAPRPTTGTATARAAEEAAPQRSEPKSSPQSKPQQARRSPAKETTRERAAPRRPVQAARPAAQPANPNVYYERDSQLGYAPQLRARTCNPATGQMPMQCYYPREGREQFPAKPLD
jgi:sialidase-1